MATITERQGTPTCDDCATVTADNGASIAAGIRMCPRCKAAADQSMAHARATNPEIAALHRMIGRA